MWVRDNYMIWEMLIISWNDKSINSTTCNDAIAVPILYVKYVRCPDDGADLFIVIITICPEFSCVLHRLP